ncbi:MAG: pyridoxal-phosphate dependent enzyme [Proteobacteria bacterium]|nr:pyridoxal-phosphate dependent enzyme [Pseudomonadota bacterium]
MALACKQIKPSIEIIGVQSTYSPHMFEKLYPNRVHNLPPRPSQTIAEGIAVKCVGELTSQILEKQLDDILLVEESSIEQAIDQLIQQSKLVVEGAGAAGLAAYNTYEHYFHHKKVGIVLCGGNIDSRILSTILLRGLVLAGKLVRLKIQIQDAPGILGKISSLIGKAGGNIFEVSHQRLFNLITVKMTDIDAIIEARDTLHIQHIIDTLNKEGFPASLIH